MAISKITTNSLADQSATPVKLSQPLTQGTAVASTSGTSIDFTGIPAWGKRITVMFQGVSTNGSSQITLRLGISSGVETSGYLGTVSNVSSGVGTNNHSTGFLLSFSAGQGAASVWHGALIVDFLSVNNWVVSGTLGQSNSNESAFISGSKSLAGTLDRIRITTVNGTDIFDAGSINILYE